MQHYSAVSDKFRQTIEVTPLTTHLASWIDEDVGGNACATKPRFTQWAACVTEAGALMTWVHVIHEVAGWMPVGAPNKAQSFFIF